MVDNNVTTLPLGRRSKRKMSDFYKDEWSALYQPGWAELAQMRELTGESWRVFATILAMLDKGNHVKIRTVDVAEHLGIRSDHVASQIKLLVEKGILLPRRLYGWRLNPRYGFKGEPDVSLRRAVGGELVLVD